MYDNFLNVNYQKKKREMREEKYRIKMDNRLSRLIPVFTNCDFNYNTIKKEKEPFYSYTIAEIFYIINIVKKNIYFKII